MSVHEQFAEDLALYALGSLEGEEQAALEKHLAECASCRRELEQLRGDLSVLCLAAAGPKPPVRARRRLMSALAREPRPRVAAPAPARARSWWGALGWAAAAAMVLLCWGLLRQNSSLQREVASLRAGFSNQANQRQQASELVSTLLDPEALKIELVAQGSKPQARGKAIYQRRNRNLIFLASNLPPLPAEKIYELWLFPANGGPPIAAGLFKPDLHGSATVVNPPLPAGVEAKTFAVTLEPESGPHEAPRGTAVIVGAGE
ncbi:MAG TPA: anti-sigma factor [Terriglobales bacterium]|nr:anti-sigma factor [Terriglobales bacterium]